MARKIHEATVEFDGEERTLHYHKPSGAFMFKQADLLKAGTVTNEGNARAVFKECACNPDGTPYTKEKVEELLSEDWDGVMKFLQVIVPTAVRTDGDAGKNA